MNIRSKQAVGAIALAWALFVLCLVTHAFGTAIEVQQIGLFSFAGEQSQFRLYEGWLQEAQHTDRPGSTGGSVAVDGDYRVGGIFQRAQVLSNIENFGDALTWDVWTALYGAGVGNAVYMSFQVNEPVDFSFSLTNTELGMGGIFGQGTSGVLEAGNYLSWYLDTWNQAGGDEAVYGGFVLNMDNQSVPDTGSTLLLLGIGVVGVLAVKRRMALA